MTFAVVGTLSTNIQSNKQKETKKTLNFSMMFYGITSTVMGSGSILLNRKPKNGFHGSEKKKHVIVVSEDTKSIKKRQKMIPARNSHITRALNLVTYVYMCISST